MRAGVPGLNEVFFNQEHFLAIGFKQPNVENVDIRQRALFQIDGDVTIFEGHILVGDRVRLNQTEFRAASAAVDHMDLKIQTCLSQGFHFRLGRIVDADFFSFFHVCTSFSLV